MSKYPWQQRQDERREERRPKKKVYQVKIARRTKEGQKEDRLYSGMRLKFLEEHPVCQCGADGCTGVATEIHHRRGRGIWFLIVSTWLAVCHWCHVKIEREPHWAKQNGYSEDRLE
jgi:hypothetical protein